MAMSTDVAVVEDESRLLFNKKLGTFVQYFQIALPLNRNNLPLQLIDPTVIAQNLMACENTDDVPDDAVLDATRQVEYSEGFPTIDGVPIWERLDGETIPYYNIFKEYREMRHVSATGSRSIMQLSNSTSISGRFLGYIAKVYHWQVRVLAYDQYRQGEKMRANELKIEALENRHMKVADTLMTDAMTYLEKHPDQLSPKVALQMLQLGMKAGRLSLGLNPDKPGSDPGSNNGAGAGSKVNINVNQTNNGNNASGSSDYEVIDATGQNQRNAGPRKEVDVSYLQSVVHILEKSGAFDAAKDFDPKDVEEGVIDTAAEADADFEANYEIVR